MRSPSSDKIECPLCSGAGKLTRAEFWTVSALRIRPRRPAFRRGSFPAASEQTRPRSPKRMVSLRNELTKRAAEIREHHKDELRLSNPKERISPGVSKDCLREVAQLRERNQELEDRDGEGRARRQARRMDFAERRRTWAGSPSARSSQERRFSSLTAIPAVTPLEPQIIVDNKDKSSVAEERSSES